MGHSQSSPKTIFTAVQAYLQNKKNLNEQSKLTPKGQGKKKQNKRAQKQIHAYIDRYMKK